MAIFSFSTDRPPLKRKTANRVGAICPRVTLFSLGFGSPFSTVSLGIIKLMVLASSAVSIKTGVVMAIFSED